MSPASEQGPPPLALAYHGVAEVPLRNDPYGLFVRPRELVRQIRALRSWGYRLVNFGELAAKVGEGQGEGHCALTFDDGFADNLETLAPLLDGERAAATVFVVSGWLGGEHPEAAGARILSSEELRSLHRAGIEIGSHTATHTDLSTLGYEDALGELAESKSELERILDSTVEVVAYPWGRIGPETLRAAHEAGYRAGCRVSGEGNWSEPLNLPRQDMDNGATLLGLRLKRDDRYEALVRSPAGALAPKLNPRRPPDGRPMSLRLNPPVVLVYHAVEDVAPEQDPGLLVTSPRHLEAHIRMLKLRGYSFITAGELLDDGAEARPPSKTAVLTFDDGFLDWLTVALPLLKRLEVRASFYVCSGLIGSRLDTVEGDAGRLLDEQQVRELHRAGMELGSHSVSHPDLRKLDDDELARELTESKVEIERLTGQPCRTFAYPFGLFDERVEQAVGAAGYELALTWQPGPWRPLAVPRLPAPARHGAIWLGLNVLGVRHRWQQPPLDE